MAATFVLAALFTVPIQAEQRARENAAHEAGSGFGSRTGDGRAAGAANPRHGRRLAYCRSVWGVSGSLMRPREERSRWTADVGHMSSPWPHSPSSAAVAACSPSDGPTEPSSPAPTGSPGATTIVRAYFYLGGELGTAGLVPLIREVPETQAVGGAAMNALLAGPTADETAARAITSGVPVGSRLLGLSIEDGIATVDLSSEFESGGGSASVFIRLGQVVYTLTQFPTVQSVIFEIEGRPVTVFSSEGIVLDGPVGRERLTTIALPAIFVDRPAYGAGLGNPARVTGSANVFEAPSWSRSWTAAAPRSPKCLPWRRAARVAAGRSM